MAGHRARDEFHGESGGRKGVAATDPDDGLGAWWGGGIGGKLPVLPGHTCYLRVPLCAYRTIDHSGTYEITVGNPLGWKLDKNSGQPAGKISLTFAMPDAQQAQQVVNDMAKLKYSNWVYGTKAEPFTDFRWMSAPVYLAPLTNLAKSGDPRAVDGIGVIATPEATAVLLSLLRDPHTKVAQAAGAALATRVPYYPNDFPPTEQWDGQRRKRLVATSWRGEFAESARAFARGTLNGDPRRVWVATVILGGTGTAGDLPALMATLNRIAADSKYQQPDRTTEPDNARLLENTILAVTRRGGSINPAPTSLAERIIFARAMGADANCRPPGWQQTFRIMLGSDVPYERGVALQAIPLPLPEAFVDRVNQLIVVPKAFVQNQAIDLARRTKDRRFVPAVLKALAEGNSDVVRNAFEAAVSLRSRGEAYTGLVGRLDEPGMMDVCIYQLFQLIDGYHGGSMGDSTPAEARRIKPLWRKFIADHLADIAAGKNFPPSQFDPSLAPAHAELNVDPLGHHWP